MAQVTLPYTLTAGTPENVNNLVSNLNALVTGVNTIDTAQIATGAVTTTQILDATIVAADIANSTITAAKLAPGVAGTALTVGSVSAATERTTTSATFVDVTSASFSFTVASNSVTIIGISCEMKTGGYAFAGGNGGIRIGTVYSTLDVSYGNGGFGLLNANNTTYAKLSGCMAVHSSSSGTGSQTVAAIFNDPNTTTTYMKNVYLTAVNIPL